MKKIVLYRSKYGHTFRYAEMIANKLNCELVEFKKADKKSLQNYDTVLFGTGIYMGKMKQLKQVLNVFKDKSIIVFAVGGGPTERDDLDTLKKNNFTEEQLKLHQFFYLPGGMDVTKVKGPMKLMFKFISKVLENKKDKTHDEEEFLKGIKSPTDLVDIKHIEEIISKAQ